MKVVLTRKPLVYIVALFHFDCGFSFFTYINIIIDNCVNELSCRPDAQPDLNITQSLVNCTGVVEITCFRCTTDRVGGNTLQM